MTVDVLESVSKHLCPSSRLTFAELDEETFAAGTRWGDMAVLVIDDDSLTVNGDSFAHDITCPPENRTKKLSSLLKLCPQVKRLCIQTRLRECDLPVLKEKAKLLKKLYITCDNFGRDQIQYPGFSFEKLRSLHISMTADLPLSIHAILEKSAIEAYFSPTLRRVCLTGVTLTGELLDKILLLTSLRTLELIGSIIDSEVGARYVEQFGKLPDLEEFSVPPSMFSLSHKQSNTVPFSFRKLKLAKLSLHMERFDENNFQAQIKDFFPPKLEVLVLFGNYYKMKQWKKLSEIKYPTILFGPNEARVTVPGGRLDSYKLVSHYIRRPPYIVNHHPNALTAATVMQTEPWRFSLAEAITSLTPRQTPSRRGVAWNEPFPRNWAINTNHHNNNDLQFPASPPRRGSRRGRGVARGGSRVIEPRTAPPLALPAPRTSLSAPSVLPPNSSDNPTAPQGQRSNISSTSPVSNRTDGSLRTFPPSPQRLAMEISPVPNTPAEAPVLPQEPLNGARAQPTEEGFQIITEFLATVAEIINEANEQTTRPQDGNNDGNTSQPQPPTGGPAPPPDPSRNSRRNQ
ncbi:unnamed protein product [Caenorhabditis auriculariae]|uniref:Uncharacterized protein n=1 Tax=Caenorhabditis auriculariae TaxID=2777116 RepID=A0A8S1HVY3_9PELO|nr:unnamed protein product [Caenorhabditis auriculariae]